MFSLDCHRAPLPSILLITYFLLLPVQLVLQHSLLLRLRICMCRPYSLQLNFTLLFEIFNFLHFAKVILILLFFISNFLLLLLSIMEILNGTLGLKGLLLSNSLYTLLSDLLFLLLYEALFVIFPIQYFAPHVGGYAELAWFLDLGEVADGFTECWLLHNVDWRLLKLADEIAFVVVVFNIGCGLWHLMRGLFFIIEKFWSILHF